MLTLVEFDDWAAIYVYGRGVYQGHVGDCRIHALRLAGVQRRPASPDEEDYTADTGSAPPVI